MTAVLLNGVLYKLTSHSRMNERKEKECGGKKST